MLPTRGEPYLERERNGRRAVTIDYLADHPDFVPTLARESLDFYRTLLPEETLESRCAKLRAHRNKEALPLALVAHDGGEVMGMAALREHDLEGHDQLTPWLGGVFVRTQHRGRGIGSVLCRAIEEKARNMGFAMLYLFTIDQQRLYARLGWQHLQTASWHGAKIDIMTKRLTFSGEVQPAKN